MSDVTADSTPGYLCCLENVSKTKMLAGMITFFLFDMKEDIFLVQEFIFFFLLHPQLFQIKIKIFKTIF